MIGNLDEGTWSETIERLKEAGVAVDANVLVQYVLRESYLATTDDLRLYAEKVKYSNSLKKAERLEQLRELLCTLSKDFTSLCEMRELDSKALQLVVARLSQLMAVLAPALSDDV